MKEGGLSGRSLERLVGGPDGQENRIGYRVTQGLATLSCDRADARPESSPRILYVKSDLGES